MENQCKSYCECCCPRKKCFKHGFRSDNCRIVDYESKSVKKYYHIG